MISELRKPRDYGHMHATLEHTVMTQHSMKRGIKEFGEAGVDAVLKELQQLHDRKVLEPVSVGNMTKEERRASLQYLMFLKKKRNGTIKGRGCADGRRQRLHTTKEEAQLANGCNRGSNAIMCDRRHGKEGRCYRGYTRSIHASRHG
jgi:hypothetical protein